MGETLKALRDSPKTAAAKAKFILATDGVTLEAEDLAGGETVASDYPDFARHFGFFLPLAGISTVQEIKDNPIDVRATGRLNKLYVELLRDNPEWATEARRHDMNHFMARLIFCFFAEDTDIFHGGGLFTNTVEQMSERDSSNTHQVIGTRVPRHEHQDRRPRRSETAALGRRLPVRERRAVRRQHRRAALHPHRAQLSAAGGRARAGAKSTRTSSAP